MVEKSAVSVLTRNNDPSPVYDYSRTRPINQIGDLRWFLEVDSHLERDKHIEWERLLERHNLPATFLHLCQECCLSLIGGHTDPSTGRILASSTTTDKFYFLVRMYSVLYGHRNVYSDWINFSFAELKSIVVNDLHAYRKEYQEKNGELPVHIGRAYITRYLFMFRFFANEGHLISPFSHSELTYIHSSSDLVSEYLASQGLTTSQFLQTNHHQFIPFHIALPWLNYIVERYSSEDFNFLRLKSLLMRWRHEEADARYRTTHSLIGRLVTMQKYLRGEETRWSHYRESAYRLHNAYIRFSNNIFGEVVDLQKFISWLKAEAGDRGKISGVTPEIDYLSHLFAAIAITNGPRRSEIVCLKLSDFQEISDDVSDYRSFIHKTNEGIPTIRQIAGFVHSMAKKACDLGPIDRLKDGVHLFYGRATTAYSGEIGNRAELFNRSYQLFLDSLPDELAEEFRCEMPTVSPHQARHLFAAFALRTSDGNVFENIRHHFRHQFRSFMTNEYTEYKLSDIEQKETEREYIREILGRIANHEDHGYFGPMLSTLDRLIDEYVQFTPGEVINELNVALDQIVDLIDTIRVHEWGLCIPITERRNNAKCYDKSTKIPQYDSASTFENCSGCPFFLSQKACIEDIQRIGIGISQTLEHHPFVSGSIRLVLETSLKRVEQLIAQGAQA